MNYPEAMKNDDFSLLPYTPFVTTCGDPPLPSVALDCFLLVQRQSYTHPLCLNSFSEVRAKYLPEGLARPWFTNKSHWSVLRLVSYHHSALNFWHTPR